MLRSRIKIQSYADSSKQPSKQHHFVLRIPSKGRSNSEGCRSKLRMEIVEGFYMRPRRSPCPRSNRPKRKAEMKPFRSFKPKSSLLNFGSADKNDPLCSLQMFEGKQAEHTASTTSKASGRAKIQNKTFRSFVSPTNAEALITIKSTNVISFSILQILK